MPPFTGQNVHNTPHKFRRKKVKLLSTVQFLQPFHKNCEILDSVAALEKEATTLEALFVLLEQTLNMVGPSHQTSSSSLHFQQLAKKVKTSLKFEDKNSLNSVYYTLVILFQEELSSSVLLNSNSNVCL